MHKFLKFIFWIKFCMFRTVPLSIIRSFSLYTQQSYVIQVCLQLVNRIKTELQFRPDPAALQVVWHIPLLCVQWKTPDDGKSNCAKHAEFYSKNKFEKLVHLVGFYYKHLSRCTVTWTSNWFCSSLVATLCKGKFTTSALVLAEGRRCQMRSSEPVIIFVFRQHYINAYIYVVGK